MNNEVKSKETFVAQMLFVFEDFWENYLKLKKENVWDF